MNSLQPYYLVSRITCAVVLLLLAIPVTAAPLSDLEVICSSVESHFPDELVFTIEVQSDAGDIVDAALFYQVGWNEAEAVGLPEPFTPSPISFHFGISCWHQTQSPTVDLIASRYTSWLKARLTSEASCLSGSSFVFSEPLTGTLIFL